ncbi:hypothetical protein SEA_GODONK_21 [Gordonia phage GodonK]|uniref:Uncharacterized protein n=1 Tax=Gordonia phage GodonK TaxID=2562192 RepID=A0A4D6E1U8_9CAUD|nr:hypothetical protein HOV33_gp021 [Gordonia phage GodonK]QBZ72640.1 hypothetical protein SEA_GODONK_21 [Gordonia phage GodonK]
MAIQTTRDCHKSMHQGHVHQGLGRSRHDVYQEDPEDGQETFQGRCVCGWWSRRVYVERVARLYMKNHTEGGDNSFEGKMMRVLGR